MKDDVLIIGGGAAGLCTAVAIKQKAPALSVRLLESLPRVGKKLAATGNGRCNITNRAVTIDRYHGKDVSFAEYALNRYDNAACEAFFSRIGVPFVYEGDKAYPASLQAASVVDCLRFAAEEAGVTVCTETKVDKIQTVKDGYKILVGDFAFYAEKVVLATGLLSGGTAYGCDGGMLEILKKAGFATEPLSPAIVQLKTETEVVRQLKGIKVQAAVTLSAGGKILRRDAGEVLFCDYGLSGPPILQISGAAAKAGTPATVSLDLFPETDFEKLTQVCKERAENLKNRTLEDFFTGMLQKRLGQVILKLCGGKLSAPVSGLQENDIRKIVSLLKDFSFAVTGTNGFVNSQVTAGGLSTKELDPKTMMFKDAPGLYAIGELVDIDGDCGGFNLRWAWSSALCAADHIAGKNG